MPVSNTRQGEATDDQIHPSIRDTIANALPDYKAMLEALQEQINENNKGWVEDVVRSLREIQVERVMVQQAAEYASQFKQTTFDIRGVIVDNMLGSTLYFGPSSIDTGTGEGDANFMSQSFARCPVETRLAMPVHFRRDIYFRFGAVVTPTSATYCAVYLLSQPVAYFTD